MSSGYQLTDLEKSRLENGDLTYYIEATRFPLTASEVYVLSITTTVGGQSKVDQVQLRSSPFMLIPGASPQAPIQATTSRLNILSRVVWPASIFNSRSTASRTAAEPLTSGIIVLVCGIIAKCVLCILLSEDDFHSFY